MHNINEIKIKKNDIYWGYLAQLIVIISGLVLLPLILHYLSDEEIGFNYLMLSVAAIIQLLDFGFSSQFSRNFSYVFSGAQKLEKNNLDENNNIDNVNYKLLKKLISSAKLVYFIISTLSLVFLLTLGTYYISITTNQFTNVDNALSIWLLFSFSIFLNIYFTYYNSLVLGRGLIAKFNKITILGRILQLVLNVTLLQIGYGLLGIVIGNFVYPFCTRYLLHRIFYDQEIKYELSKEIVTFREVIDTFKIVWYNTKKIGLVTLGSYIINKSSLFLSGLYLSLPQVASFGLMLQLFGYVTTIGSTLNSVIQPRLSSLRISNKKEILIREFALSMSYYYILQILGSMFVITIVPRLLNFIDSSVILPASTILVIYAVIKILEQNHSLFATLIVIGNNVPFVKPSLMSGLAIITVIILWSNYIGTSILVFVLVPGLVQLLYNNWKWPKVVFKDYDIDVFKYFHIVLIEFNKSIKKQYNIYVGRYL